MAILALSPTGPYWSGSKAEVNLSFDNLRDYQWERLLTMLWKYPGISGPFENRYEPDSETIPTSVKMPQPTDTYSLFGAYEIESGVRAGFEMLVTRSLFECVSLLIPLGMFSNVTSDPQDPGLNLIEDHFYTLALKVYEVVTFDIAAIGVDRGCQLLIELVGDPNLRNAFFKQGNFLARDDTLAALRLEPKAYQEVQPTLRWCPPKA